MATDYLSLIAKATQIFQASFPDAVLFAATGYPESGVAVRPEDLSKWSFLGTTSGPNVAEIKYSNGTFSDPVIIGIWVGLVQSDQLPQGTIKLGQAIEILNKNGHPQGFTSIGMGTPVVQDPQPMFWFCVNGQTQGVSAATGEFFEDLFPCNGDSLAGSLRK
jgi:hypothetical protein